MKSDSLVVPVQISLLNIADVTDAQLSASMPLLGPGETARLDRISAVSRRRQFLAGRLLLRWSVAQLLQLDFDALTVEERPQQAPLLQVAGDVSAPHFSISHSGDWVACAVSRITAIGLDIELINDQRDLARLAAHSFSPADLQWWQQQADPVAAFYRLWSIREAHFKLTQQYCTDLADYPAAYCVAVEHTQLSMALVTAVAQSAAPQCIPVPWSLMVGEL